MKYKILGYERHGGAEMPNDQIVPYWYYRVEDHPENAEGFRTVRCLITEEEFIREHKSCKN